MSLLDLQIGSLTFVIAKFQISREGVNIGLSVSRVLDHFGSRKKALMTRSVSVFRGTVSHLLGRMHRVLRRAARQGLDLQARDLVVGCPLQYLLALVDFSM